MHSSTIESDLKLLILFEKLKQFPDELIHNFLYSY